MWLAQADAVKWTDIGTFAATAVQTVVVVVALVVAYFQYRSAVDAGRIQLTIDTFKELKKKALSDAIDRTSAHLHYREDWPALTADLKKAEDDAARIQREQDLFTIANEFSKVWQLYRSSLISRTLYLEEFDELTLFVCGSVSGVYEIYDQPDYKGLFRLAERCKANYIRRKGRYKLLCDLDIPPVESVGTQSLQS
ncbi:MAG: hypothetical protein JO083_05670 [Candidatus Eremiobacteraeota bacterium]|nr:hypothetical protein [Candidatus Eremiobacteraeota bacterium]